MKNSFNLMTLQEAIDLLQVSRSTIDRWRKSKQLPFMKIGKEIFFNKEDIEQWLHSYKKINHPIIQHTEVPKKITIGYQSQTAHMWSPLIMKELRIFEEELALIYPSCPIEVQWVNASNGLELVEGMIAGKIQIASLGDYPIIISQQLSTLLPNFRPILLGFDGKTARSEGISLVLSRNTLFNDLDDLSSNTITTVINSSAGHRLNQLLPKLKNDHYQIINQDMNVSFSNIVQNNPAASVMWEPYISLAELQGATCIHSDLFADDYLTGLVTQDEWAQLNEEIIIAYLKAHLRTHLYSRQYPLKVGKIINKMTGISSEISANIISKVRWDAAVYHQDIYTLQKLMSTNLSNFSASLVSENTSIKYRGYYLDEAAKQLSLARVYEQPLKGAWDEERLY